jgi:hypothetical protein
MSLLCLAIKLLTSITLLLIIITCANDIINLMCMLSICYHLLLCIYAVKGIGYFKDCLRMLDVDHCMQDVESKDVVR